MHIALSGHMSGVVRRTGRRPVRRFALAAMTTVALLGSSCSGPTSTGVDYTNKTANTWDLLYLAIIEIQVRCPDFGAELFNKYIEGSLAWGTSVPYGEAEISTDGWIRMNGAYYSGTGDLEMLIADLYHEAAHALNNESDGASSNNDPWGRPDLNHVSYDDNYLNGTCPF